MKTETKNRKFFIATYIEDKKIKSFCEDNLLGAINKRRIIDMTSF